MKITTVIPAYKSKYLMELLASLIQQTVAPDKVIFSDDSPDESFTKILNSEPVKSLVAGLNISVIKGPRRGAHANWAHCIEAWGGSTELLHILCDDDIIYPHFYERHTQAHMSGTFSSTVSRRWYANESGQPLRQSLNVPDIIANHAQRMISLDADILFLMTVAKGANWLGEVSNTVMRHEVAELIRMREFNSISIAGLEDLGSFICGALTNPLCFINEHLGFFRQSPDQNSSLTMGMPLKLAFLAYIALCIIGRNSGRLNQDQTQYVIDLVGSSFMWHYRDEADVAEMRSILPDLIGKKDKAESIFLKYWENLKSA